MSQRANEIVAAIHSLPEQERDEIVAMLLMRNAPLTDDMLCQIADEAFQELDRAEAAHA